MGGSTPTFRFRDPTLTTKGPRPRSEPVDSSHVVPDDAGILSLEGGNVTLIMAAPGAPDEYPERDSWVTWAGGGWAGWLGGEQDDDPCSLLELCRYKDGVAVQHSKHQETR